MVTVEPFSKLTRALRWISRLAKKRGLVSEKIWYVHAYRSKAMSNIKQRSYVLALSYVCGDVCSKGFALTDRWLALLYCRLCSTCSFLILFDTFFALEIAIYTQYQHKSSRYQYLVFFSALCFSNWKTIIIMNYCSEFCTVWKWQIGLFIG